MGVVGRLRDWSFRLGFRGRFRIKPQQPWMPCEAWQYNSRLALARIFHIRIRMGGTIPIIARDTYINGHGRMLVKLLDLFTIADGAGEEYDIGELATYLNDAVLVAPSMLLVPEVAWAAASVPGAGIVTRLDLYPALSQAAKPDFGVAATPSQLMPAWNSSSGVRPLRSTPGWPFGKVIPPHGLLAPVGL